jgi:histidinol-phosphate aminotransferase
LAYPPQQVFDDLYREQVLVRDVSSYPMLSRCLRVTVGTPQENNRFLDTLRASLEARAAGKTVSSRGVQT